jgi:hypothetical protein
VSWFDNPRGGVLEIPPELTPTGLALELHVDISGDATQATWLLEDGTLLSRPPVASA